MFSDGTGNGAAKRHGTNVRRLYQSLDLHDPDQVAFYDDGVGSQEFLPMKLLGGAFGFGLKRNVLQMYRFVCCAWRNAQAEGREPCLYLFGFSRGAYTVRVLAGMIAHCGLFTEFDDDAHLDRVCRENYAAFRSCFRRGALYQLYRRLKGCGDQGTGNVKRPDIAFIGVWDTVDAYGLPIDELATIWDWLIYPIRFPDQDLSPIVRHARHALSIDDQRLTFHPLLWNEEHQPGPNHEFPADGAPRRPDIRQVWFPGVHADVGGGYPESELAMLALHWMMREAAAARPGCPGLRYVPGALEQVKLHSDWNGKQHDSRAWLAAFYRYKPRDIDLLVDDRQLGVRVGRPLIHRSAFERIRAGISGYLPTGLPAEYRVESVADDEAPDFEPAAGQAQRRYDSMLAARDVIFWRRWLYGGFLAVSALSLAPLGLDDDPGERVCIGFGCLFEPLFAVLGALLPDMVETWLGALMRHPGWLLASLGGIILLFVLKGRAHAATLQRARHAWGELLDGSPPVAAPPSAVQRFRRRANSRPRRFGKMLMASLTLLLLVVVLVTALYTYFDRVRTLLG